MTKLRKDYENRINSLQFIKKYEQKNNKISSAKDILAFSEDYRELEKEVFVCFYLGTKNQIIRREIVNMGILDCSIIHPREIFKSAILFSASRIILSHNHPSGDPSPSEEDLAITKKMIEIGDLIGIEVLDHVIVTKDKYWSYIEG